MNQHEKTAVLIYGMAARDFTDALDLIRDPSTSDESLDLLYDMVTYQPGSNTDTDLNRLLRGPLERELWKRKQAQQ